jgi:cobalt-zinc-cadmium efflux system membrane fusion protein
MNARTLSAAARMRPWTAVGRYSNAIVGGVVMVAGILLLVGLRLGWIDLLAAVEEGPAEVPAEAAGAPTTIDLSPEKLQAAKLAITKVRRGPVAPMRSVPGQIQYDAAKKVEIPSPVSGIVMEVLVQPGQEVTEHEPLASLSSREVGLARDEVLKRKAELELAHREEQRASEVAANVEHLLSLLENRPPLMELETALSGRVLGDYREKIIGAYSKLLLAERTSEASAVLESGTLSNRLIEERRSAREQAAAQYNGARETARFAASQEREAKRAAAEQAQRLLSVSEQALANLLGPLADMTPVAKREQLSQLTLLAPITGRIEERHAVKSARIEQGSPLFLIANTDVMWVAAEIHERDWKALEISKPGSTIGVTVPALGENQRLQGKVLFVGGQLGSETRSVPLVAEVKNTAGRLKAGMFAWTAIPLDEPHMALVVPASAIQQHENQAFVFVPTGERSFRRVDDDVGVESEGHVENLKGLEEGDEVVDQRAFVLKSELLLEREE